MSINAKVLKETPAATGKHESELTIALDLPAIGWLTIRKIKKFRKDDGTFWLSFPSVVVGEKDGRPEFAPVVEFGEAKKTVMDAMITAVRAYTPPENARLSSAE